jgi:DNA uptake protein ComE-like DNA-binding protein
MTRTLIRTVLLAATCVVAIGACQADGMDDAADTTTAGTAQAPAADGALLDPDAATREQLMALPGMDAEAADSLLAHRPYANMLAVDSVLAPHLSEAERETLYGRLFKPLDLNTATGPEILLIPNLGDRMVHEFEEYRPYTNIEQFRREMGKYVDEGEVARLERYVAIR